MVITRVRHNGSVSLGLLALSPGYPQGVGLSTALVMRLSPPACLVHGWSQWVLIPAAASFGVVPVTALARAHEGMTRGGGDGQLRRPPLAVTRDARLREDLRLLGAAGSVQIDVAHDPDFSRWRSAPLILLGADTVSAEAPPGLPDRDSVIVVGRGLDHQALCDRADRWGARFVAVLPEAQPWLVDRLADCGVGERHGRVVAVVGACGGAGATVLAAGLAITARRQWSTLLIDVDHWGAGIDLTLGWERVRGLRWPALADARGPVDPSVFIEALPQDGKLAVLSCDRTDWRGPTSAAVMAAIDAGRRGCGLVVVDLSRRADDVATCVVNNADHILLVVPAELRACAAAQRVMAGFDGSRTDFSLIVRDPAPRGISEQQIAQTLDLPLAGVLRSEPHVAQAVERGSLRAGLGRGSFVSLCQTLLAHVAESPLRTAQARRRVGVR